MHRASGTASKPRVSVIVPCRNEVGNVGRLVERLPELGAQTELIFVDGSSSDGTPDRIQEIIDSHPERAIRLLHQTKEGGKARAVFEGFNAAANDVLIILDADMTVAPEDLPLFVEALAGERGALVNGSRFRFAMEERAMPPANQLGNRAFSWLMTWLIGATVTDTLCGTKALFRHDWEKIRGVRALLGGHDLWGDFDLLLGAALVGLQIIEIPVHYAARVSGESKMRPLRSGVALSRTCLAGLYQLKVKRLINRFRTG